MTILRKKKIIIGVCGGIASYKIPFLVRLLIKEGASVKIIMTESATKFVTPLTLSTLSKNPVYKSFIKEDKETVSWNNHVDLGLWADYMIIAPATSNTISKMATSQCDNLLMATYLSAKCPVFVFPAMDLDMYKNSALQKNLKYLRNSGINVVEAEEGELASGLSGQGRMPEPEKIVSEVKKRIASGLPLFNKNILVSAGPTHEAIDPVRFIGNNSSGKMGIEIAQEAIKQGANVHLVLGPTNINISNSEINITKVTSAEEMHQAIEGLFEKMDIVVMSAAVADYKPKFKNDTKLKKKDTKLSIDLIPTIDILKGLGQKKKKQFLVGFALETNNEKDNAKIKLKNKNLDMIVLNSLQDKGAGFGLDTNKVTVFHKNQEEPLLFELKSKKEVAKDIINEIIINH